MEPDEYLTTKQAAALAQVHAETVRRWVRMGLLPARRQRGRGNTGREIRILRADLLHFLGRNSDGPQDGEG